MWWEDRVITGVSVVVVWAQMDPQEMMSIHHIVPQR